MSLIKYKPCWRIIDDSTYEIFGKMYYRDQISLLDLAHRLHLNTIGTSAFSSGKEALIAYACIQARLETWRQPTHHYDSAVFILLHVVLSEYEDICI
jgi:hypothetical protein